MRLVFAIILISLISILLGIALILPPTGAGCKLDAPAGFAVNLYDRPEGNQTGMLPSGEVVTLLSSRGFWRHIQTGEGVDGWIWSDSFCGK